MQSLLPGSNDLQAQHDASILTLRCSNTSTGKVHHRPNRSSYCQKPNQTVITSSPGHGHNDHDGFVLGLGLNYRTITDDVKRLTNRFSWSPVTRPVIELGLQNENKLTSVQGKTRICLCLLVTAARHRLTIHVLCTKYHAEALTCLKRLLVRHITKERFNSSNCALYHGPVFHSHLCQILWIGMSMVNVRSSHHFVLDLTSSTWISNWIIFSDST